MAGKSVGRLFQRVCQQTARGTLISINQSATKAAQQPAKPSWLLAAAPFVWETPNASEPIDDDDDDDEYEYVDDDEDDEEEEEMTLRGDMMKSKPTTEKYRNWSDNAESNPQYRKTVNDARRILQTPPPPPPQFPQFPTGFCVDPDKVPPVPPTLPTLKFLEFQDENKNNSKLPATCPKTRPPIAEYAECPPAHMNVTPKMPDLPFCDKPVPPPALPMPPPCGELGPPPPPPPNPPGILCEVERPPPALPAPPPMSYMLPPPPRVFEPQSNQQTRPLPCLPEKISGTGMAKCTDEGVANDKCGNNDALTRIGDVPSVPKFRGVTNNNEAAAGGNHLPPPPPVISATPMSNSSYWRDVSQEGMMISAQQTKKKKRVRRKLKNASVDQEQIQQTNEASPAPEIEVVPENKPENKPEEEEEFKVLWSSRRNGRR